MRSLLTTLVAALALLTLSGADVYAGSKGGSSSHPSPKAAPPGSRTSKTHVQKGPSQGDKDTAHQTSKKKADVKTQGRAGAERKTSGKKPKHEKKKPNVKNRKKKNAQGDTGGGDMGDGGPTGGAGSNPASNGDVSRSRPADDDPGDDDQDDDDTDDDADDAP